MNTTATAVFELKPTVVNFRCESEVFYKRDDPCDMPPVGNLITEYRFDSSSGFIAELAGHILEVLCYDTTVNFQQDVVPWLQTRNPSETNGPAFTSAEQHIDEPWYSKYLAYFGGTYPRWVTWANTNIQHLQLVDAGTAYFSDQNEVAATAGEVYVSGQYTIKQFIVWNRGCGDYELLATYSIERKSYGTGTKLSITKSPGCPGGEQVVECLAGW